MATETNVKTHLARFGLGVMCCAVIAAYVLFLKYAPLWVLWAIVLPALIYTVGYLTLDVLRSRAALKSPDGRAGQ